MVSLRTFFFLLALFSIRLQAGEGVPIFLFTGQSNTVGFQRNEEVYLKTQVSAPMGCKHAPSNRGASEEFRFYSNLREAVLKGEKIGCAWEFSAMLENTDFRKDSQVRFAIAQSGSGGRAAKEWNGEDGPRYKEAVDAVKSTMMRLDTPSFLKAIVINQGERNASNGADWIQPWESFISKIREEFGSEVQVFVQGLNSTGLFERSQKHSSGWKKVRQQQVELCDKLEGVHFISTDFNFEKPLVRDDVHWNVRGLAFLGRATLEEFQKKKAL